MPRKKQSQEIMKKRMDDFSEEVGDLAQRFGKKMKTRHDDSLGIVGPIIRTVVGIIFFVISIWVLNILNRYLLSVFVSNLTMFLYANIAIFFIASLFFNYADYSRRFKHYCLVSPFVGAFKAVFILWIITSILIFVGGYSNLGVLMNLSRLVYSNLYGIFGLVLIIGYLACFVCCLRGKGCCKWSK
jgi:hypothetical protein